MFWKKRRAAEEPSKPKAKKLSPKETMANQVEQLGPGQTLSYRLLEPYGSGLAVIELNPQYPGKGKKYILSREEIVDGKPAGKRSHFLDSNKAKDIAGWIIDRGGELFSSTEEGA